MKFSELPSKKIIEETISSLKKNGVSAELVDTGKEAKDRALSLIPKGAEVMTMTSVTLDSIGVMDEINESGNFDSVKKKLSEMDRETQGSEMQKLGAAPDWAVGSVHAVTQDGKVLVASNTGSQIPAYVYGASHVIWVVGVQKIVKDVELGKKRIYEYILPLESERARKAYNLPETYDSFVSKLLVVNRETDDKRLHIIFVNDKLGF